MGLSINDVFEIVTLFQNSDMENASLCMMGKQDIEKMEWNLFMQKVNMYGLRFDQELCTKIKHTEKIDSYDLFKMFGFREVYALDYSKYEGANIVYDLNTEKLPEELNEKFDFVINGGTLEHVFNQADALRNMSKMVKRGGYIYHLSPLTGWVNHGFFSMSPTLFLDYYTVNGWKINKCDMSISEVERTNGYKAKSYSMDFRMFNSDYEINQYANAAGKATLLRCIAQKKEISKTELIPIQGMYVDVYRECSSKKINYSKIIDFFRERKEINIALYGAGHDCNMLINQLHKNDMEQSVKYIFESGLNHAGESYRGYQIAFPTTKKLNEVDVILITSSKYEDEIYEILASKEIDMKKVYRISGFME